MQLKQLMDNHGDTAGLVQLIVNQLRALLQEARFDGTGLWEYIIGWVKDKALEKLKEVLEEELGKKAAGALLSILQDIYSSLDAIENIDDLKALCRTYNKTVIDAVRPVPRRLPTTSPVAVSPPISKASVPGSGITPTVIPCQ